MEFGKTILILLLIASIQTQAELTVGIECIDENVELGEPIKINLEIHSTEKITGSAYITDMKLKREVKKLYNSQPPGCVCLPDNRFEGDLTTSYTYTPKHEGTFKITAYFREDTGINVKKEVNCTVAVTTSTSTTTTSTTQKPTSTTSTIPSSSTSTTTTPSTTTTDTTIPQATTITLVDIGGSCKTDKACHSGLCVGGNCKAYNLINLILDWIGELF